MIERIVLSIYFYLHRPNVSKQSNLMQWCFTYIIFSLCNPLMLCLSSAYTSVFLCWKLVVDGCITYFVFVTLNYFYQSLYTETGRAIKIELKGAGLFWVHNTCGFRVWPLPSGEKSVTSLQASCPAILITFLLKMTLTWKEQEVLP